MKYDARTMRSRLRKVKFRRANRTFIQPAAVNAGLKRRPRYTESGMAADQSNCFSSY
jgi:hypothetical protein